MTFDVAVVGSPFLDLTFAGLERLPSPGEEVFAKDLHVAPGGTAMQAIAAARLGLRTALVSPVPSDAFGRLLAGVLEDDGVAWLGPPAERTAVTAILPSRDGVAMATLDPREELAPEDVASIDTDAVVVSLGRLAVAPTGADRYVVTGPGEVGRFAPEDLHLLAGAKAVVVNEHEAESLTRAVDAAAASRALAGHADAAVVTRGGLGAVGAERDAIVAVPAIDVPVVDATGAGDAFVAAYVWSDRAGLDLDERVRCATLYASLSTAAPTAFAGALHLDELREEAGRRGLAWPESGSSP